MMREMRRPFRNKVIVLVAALSLLSGCVGNQAFDDPPSSDGQVGQTIGTLIGTIIGGLLGSKMGKGDGRAVMAAVGALLGAYLGGELGKALSEADRKQASEAVETALKTDADGPVVWSNPDTGNSGQVTAILMTPDQRAEPESGAESDASPKCKQVKHRAEVDGREIVETQTFCLRSGDWELQEG